MRSLPTGTVTFLFTDIEGSTKRWEQHPLQMEAALARHDAILREAIESQGGFVFETVGDAFCAAFSSPLDALRSALHAQRTLHTEAWAEEIGEVRVRMALHTAATQPQEGAYAHTYTYPSQHLNRIARLLSSGHGGQVLLSLPTQELVRDGLPEGVELRDMGEHRLKDLIRPQHVFQVVASSARWELPSEFPPLKTLDAHPNNLPVQLTPFIGREREVLAIADLLRGAGVRLVTLTGPGGTGKTRLALQVGADVMEVTDFADGVYFVELAALTDPDLVPSAIARVLGVVETGDRPLIESLKEHLKGKRLLLVLDNLEQILPVRATIDALLKAAPRLKVLTTSRVPLRLYGEREFPVPSMTLPAAGSLLPLERLTQYEAVRLFIERARDVKPDFQVTNENAPAVAEICVRLDGLPLAIELAAARVRLLPPPALLSRLQSRLKLATGGAQTLPARQQTLRNTIEWSYHLLEEAERHLFRRLAVFQGGRTLGALEAVCNFDGGLEVDVLDGVESLVSKSLLQQREGPDGEPRFWMLETIHEYAREKLRESGEEGEIRRRHADYFLDLAEEAAPRLESPQAEEYLHRLEAEHDNLRAALAWALELANEPDEEDKQPKALRFSVALFTFWLVRSHYSEGRRWLEAALAREDSIRSPLRAKALDGAAILAFEQGDYRKSKVLHEESLELYRAMGDKAGIAWALGRLAAAATALGDMQRALALAEESLSLARQAGDKRTILRSANIVGELARQQGDYTRAAVFYEEALAIAREVGNKRNTAMVLTNLGPTVSRLGDYDRAAAILSEALTLWREMASPSGAVAPLMGLGGVVVTRAESAAGDDPQSAQALRDAAVRAAKLIGAAQGLADAVGYDWEPADRAELEHSVAATQAHLDEASYQEAFTEGRALSMEQAIAYALEGT